MSAIACADETLEGAIRRRRCGALGAVLLRTCDGSIWIKVDAGDMGAVSIKQEERQTETQTETRRLALGRSMRRWGTLPSDGENGRGRCQKRERPGEDRQEDGA